jgi:hypothetical protein
MSGIRVLVAHLPSVVAERLIQTIQQQPDIEWVGNVTGWGEVAETVTQTDILILGVDDVYCLPEHCFHFLGSYPHLKILLLTTHGDEAIAYWRTLHCQQLHITSSLSLIESIRQIYSLPPF